MSAERFFMGMQKVADDRLTLVTSGEATKKLKEFHGDNMVPYTEEETREFWKQWAKDQETKKTKPTK
jgi:hypothetical protein